MNLDLHQRFQKRFHASRNTSSTEHVEVSPLSITYRNFQSNAEAPEEHIVLQEHQLSWQLPKMGQGDGRKLITCYTCQRNKSNNQKPTCYIAIAQILLVKNASKAQITISALKENNILLHKQEKVDP